MTFSLHCTKFKKTHFLWTKIFFTWTYSGYTKYCAITLKWLNFLWYLRRTLMTLAKGILFSALGVIIQCSLIAFGRNKLFCKCIWVVYFLCHSCIEWTLNKFLWKFVFCSAKICWYTSKKSAMGKPYGYIVQVLFMIQK